MPLGHLFGLLAYATILETLLAAALGPDGHHDRRVVDRGRREELQQRPHSSSVRGDECMAKVRHAQVSRYLIGAYRTREPSLCLRGLRHISNSELVTMSSSRYPVARNLSLSFSVSPEASWASKMHAPQSSRGSRNVSSPAEALGEGHHDQHGQQPQGQRRNGAQHQPGTSGRAPGHQRTENMLRNAHLDYRGGSCRPTRHPGTKMPGKDRPWYAAACRTPAFSPFQLGDRRSLHVPEEGVKVSKPLRDNAYGHKGGGEH